MAGRREKDAIFANMKTVRFQVARATAYEEVKKTSAYSGKKTQGDDDAYERIRIKDAEEEMLGRFFDEACNMLTDLLKPFIAATGTSSDFDVTLEMPSTFDEKLQPSMQRSMFSFVVLNIIASWYDFVKDEKTEATAKDAMGMLEDIRGKLYWRKPVKRIVRNRS